MLRPISNALKWQHEIWKQFKLAFVRGSCISSADRAGSTCPARLSFATPLDDIPAVAA